MFALVDPDEWATEEPNARRPERSANRAIHCPIDARIDRASECPTESINRAISICQPGNPLPTNKVTRGIASGRSLNNELLNDSARESALEARSPLRPDEQPPAYGPPPTDDEMEETFSYLAEREECFDWEEECGADDLDCAQR